MALQIADKNTLFDAAYATANNSTRRCGRALLKTAKSSSTTSSIPTAGPPTSSTTATSASSYSTATAKSPASRKYSALELSIRYIYKLPLPREQVNLGMISPTSSASTTPVKSPQPTQPTERASKVTKINFD
jgi:hypothetical protein